jgi:excisionase family DNA binding protein
MSSKQRMERAQARLREAGVQPLVYTIEEAAALLRVHRATVFRLVQAGKLERVYVGRRSARITRESLERFVREQLGDKPPELGGGEPGGVRELLRRFGL